MPLLMSGLDEKTQLKVRDSFVALLMVLGKMKKDLV